MSTINLICTNCGEEFEKDKVEYNRRIAAKKPDIPNFFCNLSCSSVYRNKIAGGNSNPNSPPPQIGNTYGQKYPTDTGWYIGRCAQDSRQDKRLIEDRVEFANHIERVWNDQQGKCAITGISLMRKNCFGKCSTDNPFVIASLDRIDNDARYEIGNIHWVSLAMNLSRNNLDLVNFKQHLKEANIV